MRVAAVAAQSRVRTCGLAISAGTRSCTSGSRPRLRRFALGLTSLVFAEFREVGRVAEEGLGPRREEREAFVVVRRRRCERRRGAQRDARLAWLLRISRICGNGDTRRRSVAEFKHSAERASRSLPWCGAVVAVGDVAANPDFSMSTPSASIQERLIADSDQRPPEHVQVPTVSNG